PPGMGSRRPLRSPSTRPTLMNRFAPTHEGLRRSPTFAADTRMNLRKRISVIVPTTPHSSVAADEVPLKVGANSHFDAALILINGLVAIGLHNGGPFGMARRL
ncbi:hypothetical protein, partial [Stenotrophomonas indicatrix]|uniref:hypothetical protein n=1 Tax=Stenotrophomonas indicatrix TaxID=2045451 RepID=UPI002FDAA8D1